MGRQRGEFIIHMPEIVKGQKRNLKTKVTVWWIIFSVNLNHHGNKVMLTEVDSPIPHVGGAPSHQLGSQTEEKENTSWASVCSFVSASYLWIQCEQLPQAPP